MRDPRNQSGDWDKNTLSVAIITKNEAHNIKRCLASVAFADDIVVVDSGSTDGTPNLCRAFGCRVIETRWLGFGRTKQLAVDACHHDWVLVIDADEVVTERLAEAIRQTVRNPRMHGYRIKRRSYFLGRMIRYSGWRNDCPLRLFDRRQGGFNAKMVHEGVEVFSGQAGRIDAVLLHYPYPDVAAHIEKTTRYARLGATQAFDPGKNVRLIGAVLRGVGKFAKMYLLKGGMLDGRPGFILALNSAFGVYLKYLYLWEARADSSTRRRGWDRAAESENGEVCDGN